MLQIIGWLGCLYLIVKALEMAANPAYRDDSGVLKGYAVAACLLAWMGAIGFALWLAAQGASFLGQSPAMPSTDELSASVTQQCIELAKTPEAAADCVK
ncbi:hypothetical protein [Novosphingobium sp. KA1]|uniref:hypothetical protein n=1 Tax=Novosphingobium sp. (strain KA1) TaxID=164608 RepID=UPI001A8D6AD8|nr:hypothetical protein [Novosphingobium sp. KA1]QSR18404.1 hypothetical protein CA833_14610 [Novosphingobium sp. KA1]